MVIERKIFSFSILLYLIKNRFSSHTWVFSFCMFQLTSTRKNLSVMEQPSSYLQFYEESKQTCFFLKTRLLLLVNIHIYTHIVSICWKCTCHCRYRCHLQCANPSLHLLVFRNHQCSPTFLCQLSESVLFIFYNSVHLSTLNTYVWMESVVQITYSFLTESRHAGI